MQVTCIKCNNTGILTKKPTVSKGIKYEYWYVQHVSFKEGRRKTKWCYIGKELPKEYQELIHKEHSYTQSDTQTSTNLEKPKSSSFYRNSSKYHEPRWPSRLGHRLGKAEVAGSNPARGFFCPQGTHFVRRYILR